LETQIVVDEEPADSSQIQRLLTAYARAVDTKDWDLYTSLFTDDAHIDYTSAQPGLAGTPDEIIDRLRQSLEPIRMMMHYVTNVEICISGDTAQVVAMFVNPFQVPGYDSVSCCGGYYHHTMIRTADGWRSRALREETMWFVNPPDLT
jgi:ketosteroid isomerase-like protein